MSLKRSTHDYPWQIYSVYQIGRSIITLVFKKPSDTGSTQCCCYIILVAIEILKYIHTRCQIEKY